MLYIECFHCIYVIVIYILIDVGGRVGVVVVLVSNLYYICLKNDKGLFF